MIIFRISAQFLFLFLLQSTLFSQSKNFRIDLDIQESTIAPLQPILLSVEIANLSNDSALVRWPSFFWAIKLTFIHQGQAVRLGLNDCFVPKNPISFAPGQSINIPFDLRSRLPYLTSAGEYSIFATYYLDDSTFVTSDNSLFYLEVLPDNELQAEKDFQYFLQIAAPRGIIIRGKEFLENYPNSIFRSHALRITAQAMRDHKQYAESIKLLEDELKNEAISAVEKSLLYYELAWSFYRKGDIAMGIVYMEKEEVVAAAKNDLIYRWGLELERR